ncbi:MAG: DegT/DnrJ/EryC1/StrS family aminotransferase [Hymenobacter sp.]
MFSFNGNKILTTGGGGALVTYDAALAARARFLATQAKDGGPALPALRSGLQLPPRATYWPASGAARWSCCPTA